MQLERAVNDRALEDVDWEKVPVPAMIVRGSADRWVAPQVAVALASRLAHAEHHRMDGAGRLIPEDAPAALVQLLRSWIDREARAERDVP